MLYCEVFFFHLILYHSRYEVTLCIMKICNIMYTRKLVLFGRTSSVTHMEEKWADSRGNGFLHFLMSTLLLPVWWLGHFHYTCFGERFKISFSRTAFAFISGRVYNQKRRSVHDEFFSSSRRSTRKYEIKWNKKKRLPRLSDEIRWTCEKRFVLCFAWVRVWRWGPRVREMKSLFIYYAIFCCCFIENPYDTIDVFLWWWSGEKELSGVKFSPTFT